MASIYGTIKADRLNGTLGNDSIYGWMKTGGDANSVSGNDALYGGAGNDSLYGGTGNDLIDGGSGDDYLDGGAGNDTLKGGVGNDIYIVDSTSDIIIENFNPGIDFEGNVIDLDIEVVRSSVSYTLGNNLENLTLTGSNAISGTGNALNNSIIGNAANNSLNGGNGDDALEGGLGIDTLIGGTGNDSYIVDSTTDIITESLNQGTDTILSSVSYILGDNLENLTLIGSSAINGTGTASDNKIQGNDGNNSLYGAGGNDDLSGGGGIDTLYGGAGNDSLYSDFSGDILFGEAGNDRLTSRFGSNSLIGGTGNDTYVVESTLNTITENLNAGVDTVESSVSYTLGNNLENLTIRSGSATSINAIGNALDNIINVDVGDPSVKSYLFGDAGNDYLSGGGGEKILNGGTGNDTLDSAFSNDTLTGGTGADKFTIRFLSDQNVATITDFSVVDDTIVISAGGFGGGLTAGAAIKTEQFVVGTAAIDSKDRLIYNKSTGAVFFDVDGVGGTKQVQFATLSTNLAMTHNDISVIA